MLTPTRLKDRHREDLHSSKKEKSFPFYSELNLSRLSTGNDVNILWFLDTDKNQPTMEIPDCEPDQKLTQCQVVISKVFVVSLFEIHSVTSIYNSTVSTLELFSAGLRKIRCT